MFSFISRYFSTNIAIDLGTSNTLIFVKGRGLALDEPSVIVIQRESKLSDRVSLVATGHEAKAMIGRVPGEMQAIRPMKDGVIADFSAAELMLKNFIKLVFQGSFFRLSLKLVICIPCGSTQVERRAIREVALGAGASQVFLL